MIEGRLTDSEVHSISKPGKYYDGLHGLYLRVNASGSRQWAQRITVHGRVRYFGLGGYPTVTLAEARQHALRNRRIARSGGDPAEAVPWQARELPEPAAPAASTAPTFLEAMTIVIELYTPRWRNGGKSAGQWTASLNQYAVPRLGRLAVDRIEREDIRAVLEPIWLVKHETARRVKQRMRNILDWAVASGHCNENPVIGIEMLLPQSRRGKVIHHRALPYDQVGRAVRAVLASGAQPATRLAFAFLVLTAARSGEVRGAVLAEIDWKDNLWTIPGNRTKTGRRHRVPLSDGARRLLDSARRERKSGLIFPGNSGRMMSDPPMSQILRTLNIDAVPHGFRSSFRDWAAEVAGVPREVAEMALAHVTYSGAEAAYARSDLLEQRRPLMQHWCDFLQLNRPV